MQFDLDIITGEAAQALLPRLGQLVAGAEVRSYPPPVFADAVGVLDESQISEVLEPFVGHQSELNVYLARNGVIAGPRFVVLDDKWLVWNRMEGVGQREPNHLDLHLESTEQGKATLSYDDDDLEYFSGRNLLMFWDCAYMYHHWLLECAPRIILAMESEVFADCKYVFPIDRPKYVDETLDLIGLPIERRVYFNPRKVSRFESLGLSPTPLYERGNVSISALDALRRHLVPTSEASSQGDAKIFFTRRDAPSSERLLLNEDDLISALENEGYVAFESGLLTVEEQIRKVRQAKTIVYIHGSAGANLVFAAPEAQVLHLFPDCVFFFVSHGIAAASAGVKQAYLFGPSFQRDIKYHNNPWLISPGRLLHSVRKLEADPVSGRQKRTPWTRLLSLLMGVRARPKA